MSREGVKSKRANIFALFFYFDPFPYYLLLIILIKRVRTLSTNVLSYQLQAQFVFVLTKHSRLSIYKVSQICQECQVVF